MRSLANVARSATIAPPRNVSIHGAAYRETARAIVRRGQPVERAATVIGIVAELAGLASVDLAAASFVATLAAPPAALGLGIASAVAAGIMLVGATTAWLMDRHVDRRIRALEKAAGEEEAYALLVEAILEYRRERERGSQGVNSPRNAATRPAAQSVPGTVAGAGTLR